MNYRIIQNELLPIYENENKERLVNARELYGKLQSKQEFANWIKNRIKKYGSLKIWISLSMIILSRLET